MRATVKKLILAGLIFGSTFLVPFKAVHVKADPGTATWDGEGGDGLWSNPLNWSGDTLPQSGDDIIISGAAGEVLNVTQHYANLWYMKQNPLAWPFDTCEDIKTTRMTGNYTLEIYWNTPNN